MTIPWLPSGGEIVQAAPAMANLTVTGKKSETTSGGVTTYKLTLTICNKGDAEVKIKVASNAWLEKISNDKKEYPVVTKDDGTVDPVATRKKVIKETWKNPETGTDDPLAIPPGKCKDYTVSWKTKPESTYIDVFVMNPDGTLPDKFEGTGFNKGWDQIALGTFYPKGPKENYCCTFPLPFPMSLETVWTRPIQVVVDRIEGLPKGIDLVHVFPPLHQPYALDFADRGSVGVLMLRQTKPLTGKFTLTIGYRVHSPRHLRHWARTQEYELVPGKTHVPRRRAASRRG